MSEKQPFHVHCADCGHEWAAFYFPLAMDTKGMKLLKSAGKAPCPMCASSKVMCGQAKQLPLLKEPAL